MTSFTESLVGNMEVLKYKSEEVYRIVMLNLKTFVFLGLLIPVGKD
jgi:hypothetical protein